MIDIDDIKSELDLDIVQRQRRVHNLGTIDISDTKSEPDSSSLSDTGGLDDSDEIIFVKHMVRLADICMLPSITYSATHMNLT